MKKILSNILLSTILIFFIILNSIYIYNEFNIYIKEENYKFRYFAHPKYRDFWDMQGGVQYGFNREFGRTTIYLDLKNEKISECEITLVTKDGYGSTPAIDSYKDLAKLYPEESPYILFTLTKKGLLKGDESIQIYLSNTLKEYRLIRMFNLITDIERKQKERLSVFTRIYNLGPFFDKRKLIFEKIEKTEKYINEDEIKTEYVSKFASIEQIEKYIGTDKIGKLNYVLEWGSSSSNIEEIKNEIEETEGFTVEELDKIGYELVEKFNKAYKNVLYIATILKFIKIIIIILLQIIIYKVLKFKLLKVKKEVF